MITSMPAIPVRRERNKKEGSIGYFSRPHKLSLHFRPPLSHHQVTPTPSPINSPQGLTETQQHQDTAHSLARLIAQKRVFFQLSVLLPLAGALLLFIGLIQLVPGAEGKHYGMLLIILGTILLVIGLVIIIIRLFCKWQLERYEMSYIPGGVGVLPEIKVNEPSLNDVDLEKNGGGGETMESSYGQQRRSSQTQQQSTTNDKTNTADPDEVRVSTSTSFAKSSNGNGGGGGNSAPIPNYYYNPLGYCETQP